MSKFFNLISFVVACGVYLSIVSPSSARPLTEGEEQALLRRVDCGLQEIVDRRTNYQSARELNDNIRNQRQDEDLYKNVMAAPIHAIDVETINILIEHFPRLAQNLFNAVGSRNLACPMLYDVYITTMGRDSNFQEVKRAFNLALQEGLVDSRIYSAYIIAAGYNSNFREAKRVFYEVKNTKLIDACIYRAYIIAAEQNGNFEEARRVFDDANVVGMADDQVYCAYSIGKAREFKVAQSNENSGYQNPHEYKYDRSFNARLNSLVKSGRVKAAKDRFLKDYPTHSMPPTYYDFHGLGVGAAYIAVHILMEQANIGDKISIIIGRGKHSDGGKSKLREVMEIFALGTQGSVRIVPGRNPGILVLNLVARYNDEKVFKTYSSEIKRKTGSKDTYRLSQDKSFSRAQKSFSKAEKYFSKAEEYFRKAEKSFSKAQNPFGKTQSFSDEAQKFFSKAKEYFDKAQKSFIKAEGAFSGGFKNKNVSSGAYDSRRETSAWNFGKNEVIVNASNSEDISDDFWLNNTKSINELERARDVFNRAQEDFDKTRHKNPLNTPGHKLYCNACVHLISAARRVVNFSEVQKAFAEVRCRGAVDTTVAEAYIIAAGETGNFDKAQIIFNEVIKKNLADSSVCCAYIDAARRAHNFGHAQKAFEKAKTKKTADPTVYRAYIDAARQVRSFIKVREAFAEAIASNSVDSGVYAAYIFAAGAAQNYSEATKAFNQAKENGQISGSIYGAYILAAGMILDFDQAERTFQLAQEEYSSSPDIYIGYIFTARQTNNFQKAEKIFNKAEAEDLVNADLCATYIDFLIQSDKIKEASNLFMKYCSAYTPNHADSKIYNFGDCNFGITFIASHILLEQIYVHEQVTVIVGRKTHSSNENVARRAVELFVDQLNGLVEMIEDANSDRIHLRLAAKYDPDPFINARFLYSNNPAKGQSHWNLNREKKFKEAQDKNKQLSGVDTTQDGTRYIHPGLQHQKIVGDGHCLYRAVTLYLGQGEDVTFLRQRVGDNLGHNLGQYNGFIPLDEGTDSAEEYIHNLMHTNAWAGDLEINILMRLLNRPIVVIGPDGSVRNREAISQYPEDDPIFVSFDDRDHYDSFILLPGYNARAILDELLQRTPHNVSGRESGNATTVTYGAGAAGNVNSDLQVTAKTSSSGSQSSF